MNSTPASQIPNFRFRTGFDPAMTSMMPFRLADGRTVTRKYLSRNGEVEHGVINGAQLVRIPSQSDSGAEVMLYIVLPNEGKDVERIFEGLNEEALRACSFETSDGYLAIPVFRFEPEQPEQPKALRIGSVIQKAHLEINEEGAEAAAVTAFVALERVVVRTVDIRVDRPFAFAVACDGSIAVAGVVQNPNVDR